MGYNVVKLYLVNYMVWENFCFGEKIIYFFKNMFYKI